MSWAIGSHDSDRRRAKVDRLQACRVRRSGQQEEPRSRGHHTICSKLHAKRKSQLFHIAFTNARLRMNLPDDGPPSNFSFQNPLSKPIPKAIRIWKEKRARDERPYRAVLNKLSGEPFNQPRKASPISAVS